MSEIRSISEGTFVIGDTNGLTFEAGPGISVSQPSEGTVRIANDETVLWSGEINATTRTANLSEPISNFSEVKFLVKFNRSTPDAKQYLTFSTDISSFSLIGGLTDTDTSAGGAYMGFIELTIGSNNTISYVNGKQLYWGNNNVTDEMLGAVYKVVGINRISGGNNE